MHVLNPRWFAANVRPQSERAAIANLERQGFRSFLPTRAKTVRHARQFRTADAPMFPGYVFVSLDLGRDRWRSVNGTHGVVSLVMAGDVPVAVPRGVVESLQELTVGPKMVHFDPGQRVKLLSGPFADLIGTLERLDDRGRVRVLLEMMGAFVAVAATADQLMAV